MHENESTTLPAPEVRVETTDRRGAGLLLKRALQGFYFCLTTPRIVAFYLARLATGRRALGFASESIARVPGLRGVYQRQAFYGVTLAECGPDVHFGWLSTFSMPEARVGRQAYIGRYCSIGYAHIGAKAMLADGVQVLSGGREHADNLDGPRHDAAQVYRPVVIGAGAWIGAGAIIMADVGEYSVIGAGAVVTQPIPANCTAVGVPARVVKGNSR